MKGTSLQPFHSNRAKVSLAIIAAISLWPAAAPAQLKSVGYPVQNPLWEILVTDFGYADLALDRRPGFIAREYLSGEWAAAVFYSGGHNPTGPVWFQPQWFYPDWMSNSNFTVEKPVGVANPGSPTNADGFTVYQSVIKNLDVRVTINYEMLDAVTGIAQGNLPRTAGGAGGSVMSSRYVFRQTYRITNISGGTLTNVRLFQFLHGLDTSKCVYDDRTYSGAMADYRYDITQQGDTPGFDTETGALVTHHDTIAFHSRMAPSAWETGYFGRLGVDDHVKGKPGIGVHLSVEANTLNGVDVFQPPEGGWVGGAQRFDLGQLAAGASVSHEVLFTVQSTEDILSAGVHTVIRNVQKNAGNFLIDFEETTGSPVEFILLKSTDLSKPSALWEFVPLAYTIDFPQPGWNRFEIPIAPNEPSAFFRIRAIPQ